MHISDVPPFAATQELHEPGRDYDPPLSDLGGDPHESDANPTIRIKSVELDPFGEQLIYLRIYEESNSK